MSWLLALRSWVLHPVDNLAWRHKARHVPGPGDLVTNCRNRTLRVTAVHGDDLMLEDGTRCSWMHCCSWPEDT